MLVISFICIVALGVALIHDVKSGRIPNWLTFPLMTMGLGYHLVMQGTAGLVFSTSGMCIGFCLFIILYLMGGMGAGDVKLMSGIGSLIGPGNVLYAAFYTAIAGGVYALLVLIILRRGRRILSRYWIMAMTFVRTGRFAYMPKPEGEVTPVLKYGIAITAGTLIVLVQRII